MHASLALESGVVKAVVSLGWKWRIGLGWRGETKATPHPIHRPRKLAPFHATAAARQLHHLNSHPCYRIGKWQRSSINLV